MEELIGKLYDRDKELLEDFMRRMEDLLKVLLQGDNIPYHSVNGRLKERDSCIEKFQRKNYKTLDQMMDLVGLRIITHTTAEVKRVCEVIEREFKVDLENSGNKAKNMGIDKVGYLSVHYVVQMESERVNLSEYKRFNGLRCEIQVRSLLQHAWAEIEHDRSYKFAGVLPQEIQRKFYLVAGTLELMDQEFYSLSKEIDAYARHVQEETQKGNLDIPIDSTSLLEFLNNSFAEEDTGKLARHYQEKSDELIEELHDFGIDTLRQVSNLMEKKEASEWMTIKENDVSYLGIVRNAMITDNAEKYFGKAWNGHWKILEKSYADSLKKDGIDIHRIKAIEVIETGRNGPYYEIRKRSKKSATRPQEKHEN